MDEQTLRRQARERIQQGLLTAEEPLRTWAGPAGEYACAFCDRPVVRSETEFELEFHGRPAFRFHSTCHAIWQLEGRSA
jgi:peptide methionine sulfoxide reductase MsrB